MPHQMKNTGSADTSKTGFAKTLVAWFKKTAYKQRPMPWRETSDPYAIWLSEIMLQQTQVATVIGYYQRFIKRWPTIESLAKANLDDVLKAWEGLGYYARCRNLHKAAQMMVEQHQGCFPETLDDTIALPGIGRSTAGAILTFSAGTKERKPQKHPILDGNVKRVLSRLYAIQDNVAKPVVERQMWQLSETLLRQTRTHKTAWAFNQAIMELGATVCSPKQPKCLVCPVRSFCEAQAAGIQHDLPVKTKAKPTPHHHIGAAVIWDKKRQKILIQQRPKTGLLAGLWEFPGGKQEPGETIEATVCRELMEELAIEVSVGEKLATVKHAYSHFKITLHAFDCVHTKGRPKAIVADTFKWVTPQQLPDFAFPKANHPVIDKILS